MSLHAPFSDYGVRPTRYLSAPGCDFRRLHGHRGTGRFPDRVGDRSRSGAAECLAPNCLGRQRGAVFRSAAQAQGMVTLMLRRLEAISHVLALDPPEFAPILHVGSMEGKEVWIADDWCCGSCGSPPWRSKTGSLCLRILRGVRCCSQSSLGSEEGWRLLAQMTILTLPSRPGGQWRLKRVSGRVVGLLPTR
jgi:hypothetical protein